MAAAQTLSIMMDIFSDFSGLRLNRAKSTFVGGGNEKLLSNSSDAHWSFTDPVSWGATG